ncbi:hypothetical protein D9M71_500420 [compost metagenome]
MALVAMTSVQLTTPRRTFLQAAGSAAKSGEVAILLRARVNRLRRIKLCMVALHRQCILLLGFDLSGPYEHATLLAG